MSEAMTITLYRQPGTVEFTLEQPTRPLPFILFGPTSVPPFDKLRMRLSPETWQRMGCPDRLTVSPSFDPEPQPLIAEGGLCVPLDDAARQASRDIAHAQEQRLLDDMQSEP